MTVFFCDTFTLEKSDQLITLLIYLDTKICLPGYYFQERKETFCTSLNLVLFSKYKGFQSCSNSFVLGYNLACHILSVDLFTEKILTAVRSFLLTSGSTYLKVHRCHELCFHYDKQI